MSPPPTPPTPVASPLAYDDPYQLGPYQLVARLGNGGMGTVYLGRDESGRTVALKTMHPRIAATPEFRSRFRLETEAARVIGGRHGAEVVDADPYAPTPWLATECVPGPPLDEAVEQYGPLPEQAVRALGAALCEALGQLHHSGVVHRDLKPSNILLTPSGPKVIDFGIARAIGDARLTRTGAAAGTPAYMSPEQATGGEHTAAGEVFALAGVLVFALTGRGPFGGGQAADLLYRVRYGEPDLSGVPDALRPVLARCLLKEPGDRPGTAELAAHLGTVRGDFADHLPHGVLAAVTWRAAALWQAVPQRAAPPPERHGPERPSRRRMLAMAGGSALGVTAAVAGGVWAWSAFGPGSGPEAGDSPSHGPDGAPSPVWQAPTLSVNEDYDLPPIAAAGLILTMDREGLVAFDAKSGDRRWSKPEIHTERISTDGHRIHAILPEPGGPRQEGKADGKGGGTDKGEGKDEGKGLAICALDPDSGSQEILGRLPDFDGREIKDTLDASEPTAQPLRTSGEILYLAARTRKTNAAFEESTEDWHLVAFDLGAGEELWREPLPDYQFSSRSHQASAYLVARRDDRLLLTLATESASEEGDWFYLTLARDARTGKKLWEGARVPLGAGERFGGTSLAPVPTDGSHLYFGSLQLSAWRLSDGEEAWTYSTPGVDRGQKDEHGTPLALYGPPALRDGVVYAVERGRGLIAVDASDGRLLWREKQDQQEKPEKQGKQGKAKGKPRPSVGFTPIVGDKYVYVVLVEAENRTRLSAVNRKTRRSEWTFSMASPDGVGSRLIVDEESRRIVGSTLQGTYAIPLE
ncbi:serine/threonine-protein kinase [Streptomyces sp. N2-109]|uniref:Serine/threonine-protein kinase n=1 Tax=Streptomyces gossypii TaxID=2883101 RepID=A0ABT2JSU0_9ACTN|nr:serine/threonine-protein kinase [Streptomyces gossypii]MCT2590953.1 serine/threonine-protein kinase [Streptomyces gossypii]